MPTLARRSLFQRSAAAAALMVVLGGHTPYQQWVVYRRRHLLIGCHREDPQGYAQAQAIQSALVEHLPDARARVARAPDAARLASLFATDQLELGVLRAKEAQAMREAMPPFDAYGAVPLRALIRVDAHVLYAIQDFRSDHAGLVVAALADARSALPVEAPGERAGPAHPEAVHWFQDQH